MRGRSDRGQHKRLITSLCVVAIFLCFLYVYYGSIFGSSSRGAAALEYGGRSFRKLGSFYLGGDDDGMQYESSTKFEQVEGEEDAIQNLSLNLIYQMRLKLDLSVMEHYERHCPPPERRYYCLIPPPSGYNIPIKWPHSRDEVWKANIPHTHLAHEKSNQNWMVVKGEKIAFPGEAPIFTMELASIFLRLQMCESFSTYPRTYDLLHAWTVFSDIEKKGCSAEDLLLEMDRILCSSGFIIIRDKQPVIDFTRKYLSALHWEPVATADSSSDSDHEGDDIVFIVQKKLWLTSKSLRNSE